MARLDPRRNARGFEVPKYPDAHKNRSHGPAHQDASSALHVSIIMDEEGDSLRYW
tara:strand:- start:38446 stop:38610 length:165 start_codon:yes stop_codon:yes gene_type:complete